MNEEAYESLLLYKIELEKSCQFIEREYYAMFGELLTKLLELKLNAVQLKQKISYCQKRKNEGLGIDESEMETFAALHSHEAYFDYLSASKKYSHALSCLEAPSISPEDSDKIKKTFRMLMKLIHPDIHPKWQSDPLAKSIYEHAIRSYKDNDLPKLVELFDLARLYFQKKEAEIEDIEEKITSAKEEIKEIETHNPYLYHLYLDDPDKAKELKSDLGKQIEEYGSFTKELEARLNSLLERKGAEA
jgi:hypothetical protein